MNPKPLRRAAPGRVELHRLRVSVFHLGSYLGLDTRAIVRFSEVISGQRWRHCRRADFELVVNEFARLTEHEGSRRELPDAVRGWWKSEGRAG